MGLIIFCLQENLDAVAKVLDRFAIENWRTSAVVKVHAFDAAARDRRNRQATTDSALEMIASDGSVDSALIIRGPQLHQARLMDKVIVAEMTVTSMGQDPKRLIALLNQVGAGWLAEVQKKVAHWSHGIPAVESWLKQFNDLGGFRWVGERLLKNLCFCTEQELGDYIFRSVESINQPGKIKFAFLSDTLGKSGSVVANLVKKRWQDKELAEVSECISSRKHDDLVILVEDGLYSATEIIAVLDSLLGERKEGRAPKCSSISDRELLTRPVALVFGVAVDYGKEIIESYLDEHKERLKVVLEVGSALGVKVLPDGPHNNRPVYSQGVRPYFQKMVLPWALNKIQWGAGQQDAEKIIRQIGIGLWKSYVNQMVESGRWQQKSWSDDRITLCGLGMDGLGLTVIFPHSIPKATLPVFWVGGKLNYGTSQKIIEWKPLFPNA